jgi:hypothetical protein
MEQVGKVISGARPFGDVIEEFASQVYPVASSVTDDVNNEINDKVL